MELTKEDIEFALVGKPEINRREHIQRLTRLARAAQPGNAAWHILENDYGFSGDYTAADVGEAPARFGDAN